MYGFSVELSAETASFRDPGGQLYHATLPLPPVSTVIGIAGAALGFAFQRIWEFFVTHDILIGVKDVSPQRPGRGLDLWKYQKIVTNEVRSDILIREFLFRPVFRLYYGCNEKSPIEQIRQAFLAPAWALSLGTSDDIARLEAVSPVENISEAVGGTTELRHTLIPGDHADNYLFDWDAIGRTPIRQSLELPLVKRLPVDFAFEPNGERKGCEYRPFTFLTDIQKLKTPFAAYVFGQEAVPLISLSGRG
jgi:CRISPR-associated protein Cas5t